MFLQRKEIRRSRHFLRHARKYMHYKHDLLSETDREEIEMQLSRYRRAAEAGSVGEMEKLEKEISDKYESSLPEPSRQHYLAENFEILLVAFVVALGIRAYIFQPFMIPTNSMYPTLNGVTTKLIDETVATPGLLTKITRRVLAGEVFVELTIPKDDQIVGMRQSSLLHYFTKTKIDLASGKTLSLSAPITAMLVSPSFRQILPPRFDPRRTSFSYSDSQLSVSAGQSIFRGWVKTGDFLLVNKMSYHFRHPRRGEVFVFTTKNIAGIASPPGVESQHYIKRLVAVPGDRLELRRETGMPHRRPKLYINGEIATEPGLIRVMTATDGYDGYTFGPDSNGDRFSIHLGEGKYFAMGDNSDESSDSRYWGPVPAPENLVGSALVVLWPIKPHFGLIE